MALQLAQAYTYSGGVRDTGLINNSHWSKSTGLRNVGLIRNPLFYETDSVYAQCYLQSSRAAILNYYVSGAVLMTQ